MPIDAVARDDKAISLSHLAEIECIVPDVERAVELVETVFDARGVERALPAWQAGDASIERVVLGETVIAFAQPCGTGLRGEELRSHGPGVYALTFLSNDARAAARVAQGHGIAVLQLERSTWPNGAAATVAVLDTQPTLGFRIVLVDGAEPDQHKGTTALHPDLRPTEALSPMFQVEPVVQSVDTAVRLVKGVFDGCLVEKSFASKLEGISPIQRIRHVLLGDTVVQLIEMKTEAPGFSWYDLVRKRGAAVHNLTFMVRDMDATKAALKSLGIELLIEADLPWAKIIGAENVRPGGEPFCVAATRDVLGFHLELAVPWTDRQLGLLHRSVWGIS